MTSNRLCQNLLSHRTDARHNTAKTKTGPVVGDGVRDSQRGFNALCVINQDWNRPRDFEPFKVDDDWRVKPLNVQRSATVSED